MSAVIIAVLALLVVLLSALAISLFVLGRKRPESSSLLLIQNQLAELRGTLDSKLGDTNKMAQE
ncbi:MAG: hypothetical protein U1C72_02115, partial [Candidatus Pacearchaeota archaeon]|nr:hypothetical protein [Candidatus Pacearchaeota archaeon]